MGGDAGGVKLPIDQWPEQDHEQRRKRGAKNAKKTAESLSDLFDWDRAIAGYRRIARLVYGRNQ